MNRQLRENIKNFVNLDDNVFFGWGRKPSGIRAVELANQNNLKYLLLEDGFIRSVALGEDKSFSVVKDDLGIYYDATSESRLEKILKEEDLTPYIKISKKAIELIKIKKISKYNNGSLTLPPYFQNDKKKVLVIAQTKGDLSLKYGYGSEEMAKEMILKAVEDNPDAQIYLKIHPDVLAGKKESNIDIEFAKQYCKIIKENIHPVVLLEAFDKVYTQTSQMGFEALLLNKEVHVFGAPFYVGWGLERLKWHLDENLKKGILKRRNRKLSIEEVFAGAYILYSDYYNPFKKEKSDVISVINEIDSKRKELYKNSYLAIGDSHIRVFESFLFKLFFPFKKFNVIYVPGATAYGVFNLNSKTQSFNIFKKALDKRDYNKIIVSLGEVDCSIALWNKVKRDKGNIDEYLQMSVKRYKEFLKFLRAYAPVVIISPTLPTVNENTKCDDSLSGVRSQIEVSQIEKTELTLKFHNEIKKFALNENMRYVDIISFALDKNTKTVKNFLLNKNKPCDHHYERWKFALILIIKFIKEKVL